MRNDTISILGLYQYDNTIFDNMVLPEEIEDDKSVLVDNLLMDLSQFEILYPDCDFMKFAIERWSKKRLQAWEKMAGVLYEEYDPFINIVRDEERTTTETRDLAGTLDNTETRNLALASDNTVTLSTNAWDSGTDTERQKEVSGNDTTDTGTVTNARETTDTGTITRHETYHLQGDSAITDRQDVAKKEIDLRTQYNLFEIIINDFKMEFCILVY